MSEGPWGAGPAIMGVLNATHDSFSGDGLGDDLDALVARGREHVRDGATILDVGAQSTHPRAAPVGANAELAQAIPAVERLVAEVGVVVSIDTTEPHVADAALAAGARIVNDVSGLRDIQIATIAARHDAWLVVTDNGWTRPLDPTSRPADAVAARLRQLVADAVAVGMDPARVIVDPGLGFGKAVAVSLALLRETARLRDQLRPHLLLVGPSRKGFIGTTLGLDVGDRLEGTLACVAVAVAGGADIVRVHDVRPASRVIRMAAAIRGGD
ncbi:MAG TPA: dihydropteroate synthase [Candidatus Limnocylindria bacterium]|nr:dihydropteroate synthase [Candidatus Limnocylindria bacterium]